MRRPFRAFERDFGGEDMGSVAQTGLLLVPSDALGHTWVLPGVLGLLCEFAERRKFYTEYVHFWSLESGVLHGIRGIRVEYGRIQASGRSFGIRGKRIHTVGSQRGGLPHPLAVSSQSSDLPPACRWQSLLPQAH